MGPRRRRTAGILFTVAAVVFGLDRVTKVWAESTLPGHPMELIPGVLTLRFTENSGGAFSIGQSAPWFFVGVTVIVIAVVLATAFRHTSVIVAAAVGSVLGGALGNLTDRAIRAPGFRGRVIDLIDLHVWPVFNLADTAIVAGAIVLAWIGLRDRREHLEPAPAPPSPAEPPADPRR